MEHPERPVRRALIITAALAAAVVVPGVAVADQIARPPGAVDDRGYELVSQPQKESNLVQNVTVAEDGGARALYQLTGGAPGAPVGLYPTFLATRTATGWQSTSYLPPRLQLLRHNYAVSATTPDLSAAVMSAFDSVPLDTASADELLLEVSGNQQTLLHAFPWYFGGNGATVVASQNLGHLFADVPEPIDPSHQPSTPASPNLNVYDFAGGTPQLVSRLPGTGLAPLCGVVDSPNDPTTTPPGFATGIGSTDQHWASTDGSRVFFLTAGDNAPDCAVQSYELYMRDVTAGTTTLVSGPPVAGDPDNGVNRFVGATADGSLVFFRTATSLDPRDDDDANAGDMDIYRWSAATGQSVCLTCGVPSADVSGNERDAGAIVSPDGSHVYFTSPNRFADAPSAATLDAPNLYVWRLHHSLPRFIARVSRIGTTAVNSRTEVTPDGHVLLFESSQPGLDAIGGGANGGFTQLYRYDDRDDTVTCVSCPPGGVPAAHDIAWLAGSGHTLQPRERAVTDDGSTVFFTTADKLAPEDVNDSYDIYEWRDGAVHLITSGATPYTSEVIPKVVTVSADGRDLYFLDAARLTFDALDSVDKLYDARVGGGFPPPAPPAPCVGDVCHGTPSSAPDLPDPGSSSLADPGNVVPGTLALGGISAAQRARLARTGSLTLGVSVDQPGRVTAVAQATLGGHVRVVARASASARAAGTLKLTLRLSKAARAQLARRGRLRLVLVVSFSEAPAARRVAFSLSAPVHATAHGR